MKKTILVLLMLFICVSCSSEKSYDSFDEALNSISKSDKINLEHIQGNTAIDNYRVYLVDSGDESTALIRQIVLEKRNSNIYIKYISSDISLNLKKEKYIEREMKFDNSIIKMKCGLNNYTTFNGNNIIKVSEKNYSCDFYK